MIVALWLSPPSSVSSREASMLEVQAEVFHPKKERCDLCDRSLDPCHAGGSQAS